MHNLESFSQRIFKTILSEFLLCVEKATELGTEKNTIKHLRRRYILWRANGKKMKIPSNIHPRISYKLCGRYQHTQSSNQQNIPMSTLASTRKCIMVVPENFGVRNTSCGRRSLMSGKRVLPFRSPMPKVINRIVCTSTFAQ